MKKKYTLCIISIAFLFSATHGQIIKGEKFIGGSVSAYGNDYDNSTPYESSQANIFLTPKLGFPLNKSWVIGPLIGYSHSKNKNKSGQDQSLQESNNYSAGAFVRKFHSFNQIVGIFAELEASYGSGKSKNRSEASGVVYENKSKVNLFVIGLKPGIYFKPGNRFLIEASLGNIGYREVTEKPEGVDKFKSKQFSASLSNYLSFGLQFILK